MAATVFADDNDNGKKDSLERAAKANMAAAVAQRMTGGADIVAAIRRSVNAEALIDQLKI
jgi:hypothetical protein